MILLQGELGAPNLIYPPVSRLSTTVDLGRPVSRYAKALLRGFELGNFPDDVQLWHVRIHLGTSFGTDLQHVEVTADVELKDRSARDFDWRAIEIRVFFTVLAE